MLILPQRLQYSVFLQIFELMEERNNIIRALAGLSYAIAMCDGELQESERKIFKETMEEELGDDFWIAESRFDLLENETTPSIENAYNHALFTIKRNRSAFSDDMKDTFVRTLDRVAEAYKGTEDSEEFIIGRLKQDLREEGL